MASIGTQNWAKDRISPHKERLWRVLKSGVARLNRMSADDRLMFNGRCAADVLNAFVIGEARDEFESVRGSTFIEKNNTTYHALNGCILWYKQLGEDHLPSNLPTMTIDQMMQGQFDFMPNQLLMVVGFELDEMKRGLKTVELMRFGPGRRLEFVIEIAKVQVVPRVVRMPNTAKPAAVRRTKIELRNGFEQKAFGSGSE
jgi:hypothetical protein